MLLTVATPYPYVYVNSCVRHGSFTRECCDLLVWANTCCHYLSIHTGSYFVLLLLYTRSLSLSHSFALAHSLSLSLTRCRSQLLAVALALALTLFLFQSLTRARALSLAFWLSLSIIHMRAHPRSFSPSLTLSTASDIGWLRLVGSLK